MFIRNLLKDQQGATAIEYGLIVALVAIAMITGLQSVGNGLGSTFDGITTVFQDAYTP